MSIALIQGIPRKARVRVEALPEKTLVWKGVASGSLSVDLDPGKYIYKVHKVLGKKRFTGFCNQFLHELTEDQFNRLQHVQPKRSSFRITSEGPMYICGFTSCNNTYSSGTAMVMHELEHQGQKLQDVLDNMTSDEMMEAMSDGHDTAVDGGGANAKPLGEPAMIMADDNYTSTRQGKKKAAAKRGRPRKNEVVDATKE